MTKEQAARTAATSLEAIERWARLTFAAAAVGVVLLAAIAAGLGYIGLDYLRLKQGMAEVAREYGKPAHAPSPPRLR